MNKVANKLNNNIRKALASAKPLATEIPAFDYFSYQVDWSNFPNSLTINCHLHCQPKDTALTEALLGKIIQISLLKQGIKLRDYRKNISLVNP